MSKYIKSIAGNCAISDCGSKAYHLSLLNRNGFRIPIGFCLTADAFKLVMKENEIAFSLQDVKKSLKKKALENSSLENIKHKILSCRFPDILTEELVENLKSLKVEKVAIRSSGISEDSKDFSYAGMFETILNVKADINHVVPGIKKVWGSLFDIKVFGYNNEIRNFHFNLTSGVIVQEMISPRKSGVAFSMHPVTNDKDVIYIEETSNKGDKIVAGEVLPETHVISKKVLTDQSGIPWIKKLSEQLTKVEKILGIPVDVEWALDKTGINFLQVRPITTLNKNKANIWSDDNVGEVLPDIVTPLTWSILGPITNHGFRRTLQKLGVNSKSNIALFKLFNGKAYFNRTLFEQCLQQIYPSGSNEKNRSPVIIWQKIRAIIHTIAISLRFAFMLFWLPIRTKRVEKKMSFYLKGNGIDTTDTALFLLRIQRIVAFEKELMYLHFANTYIGDLFLQSLLKVERKLGLDRGKHSVLTMISNIGEAKSAAGGAALRALADSMSDYLSSEQLNFKETNRFFHLCETNRVLKKKVQKFLDQYGYMSDQEFELSYPRWSENPRSLLKILHKLTIGPSYDKPSAEDSGTIFSNERTRRDQRITFFNILNFPIKLIKLFNRNRENLKQSFIEVHFELKKLFLIVSDLFVKEGVIQSKSDLFFLKINDIITGLNNLKSGSAPELKLRIQRNRLKYEASQKMEHTIPLIETNGKLEKQIEKFVSDEYSRQGIPCSSGTVIGNARVIKKFSDADQFKEGEILITHSANPGWVPLFLLAVGVLTEIGGALSHSAIIAREYNIPMIASVQNATKIINTGDLIELDGTTGVVKILNREMV